MGDDDNAARRDAGALEPAWDSEPDPGPGGRRRAPAGRPGVGRSRRTARGGNGMVSRLIKLAVLALVIAVIVQSLPDIKRYLKIRDM